MPVKIEIAPEADTVTALLTGEIDHHGAGRLRDSIDETLRRTCPRLLVMDFGGVEFMDSSGIGIVLGRYRLMQDMGELPAPYPQGDAGGGDQQSGYPGQER